MHEVIRRNSPSAPRVDLLGMQALAKMYRATGFDSPAGKELYLQTLVGDLIVNSAYFGLVGLVPRTRQVLAGVLLGLIAGVGAVALPPKLSLSSEPTAKTSLTRALTVAMYAAGGTVAGVLARSGSSAEESESESNPEVR